MLYVHALLHGLCEMFELHRYCIRDRVTLVTLVALILKKRLIVTLVALKCVKSQNLGLLR